MTVPLDAGGQGSGGEPSSSVRRDVGTTIEGQYAFTADNVSEYARAAQDFNPLHHDPDVAARSRFGVLIASAAQSTGVFTSLLATYFAPSGQALGLEFAFKLKRAVKVGVNAQMRWTIVSSVFSDKLGGDLIDVEGT
ncbi:MAG: MaoC family dehydratase, partial [Pseudomonadota bacterium]